MFPATLPRKELVHPLKDEDLPEHLRGQEGVRRFRKKVREYLESTPAELYVVEEFVEVLAADNEDATETEMVTARSVRLCILDCYAGPSLLASLAVEHFADYLPYYREEERLAREHHDSAKHDRPLDDRPGRAVDAAHRADATSGIVFGRGLRGRDVREVAQS